MKARLEPAHRPQIQWQEIEKECAVRLRCQRYHLALLVLSRVVVDPLQVGGLSAQTWTVVHELAVNFASRKIDERHFSSARIRTQTYSIRAAGELAFPPRASPCMHCTYSVRDSPPNSTPYFRCCLRSVTSRAAVNFKLARPRCLHIRLTRESCSASMRLMAKVRKPSPRASRHSKDRARSLSKSLKKKTFPPPPPTQRGGVELVDPRVQAQLKIYDEALSLFHQQKFARAKQELEKVLEG